MLDNEIIRKQTEQWIHKVVIGLNFCPFARREMLQQTIRYRILNEASDKETVLATLKEEYEILDNQSNIATSFLILPQSWQDFKTYWQLSRAADKQIRQLKYSGVYQLATFHPDYIFAGADQADAANYTNRSPYPMLHLLREKSLSQAIDLYPDTRLIPERNISLAREKGLAFMQELRADCLLLREE
jgi:uncharacterized protein